MTLFYYLHIILLRVHVRDSEFFVPQPRSIGQDHLRVRHIHHVRAPSLRARGNHLEHVPEGEASELEQDDHGVFTSHSRCYRHL